MSKYEDGSIIVPISPGVKSGEIYALKPINGDGDLTFSRNTACDEINSLGVSTQVAANVPRYDYKADYVAPTDNSYYSFDGTNDIATILKSVISGKGNDFEVNLFITTGVDVTTQQTIIDYYNTANDNFAIQIVSGNIVSTVDNGALNNSSGAILASTSYMITLSWDASTSTNTIYIDKTAQVGTTGASTIGTTTTSIYVGATNGTSNYFNGFVKKIFTDNRILTTAERLDLYNGLPIPNKYVGANNVRKEVNGDFEGSFTSGLAANWTAPFGTPTEETVIVHGGTKAQKLSSVAGVPELNQAISTMVVGLNYKFSCWVRSDATPSVRFRDANGSGTISQVLVANTWTYLEFDNVKTSATSILDIAAISLLTGYLIIDDVKVTLSGNTLNLSEGKTVPTWYDLDHAIKATVTGAALTDTNGFGTNIYSLETCANLLLEPSFVTYFKTSRTPITQTVVGLTAGVVYTINCKGTGIITIDETGGSGRGGTVTEVNSFTYTATQTSVVITLVSGHSFDWVQMTNTAYPMNHVETLTTTVTKALDTANKGSLSALINSESLTFNVSVKALFNDSTDRSISLSDGTSNNRISIEHKDGGVIKVFVIVGGVTVYDYSTSLYTVTDMQDIKLKVKAGDFGVKINDIEIDSQDSGVSFSAAVLNRFGFDGGSGANYSESRFKKLEVYNGISNY